MSDSNVKFGFYNALYKINKFDRLYESGQMSKLFDGLILDGVYLSSREDDPTNKQFMVTANSGMSVKVAPGRAWFLGMYIVSTSSINVPIGSNSTANDRIDAIVIEINSKATVHDPSEPYTERYTSIKAVQGTPASEPQRPTMTHANGIDQYPLAYVTVSAGTTEIKSYDIDYIVGIDTPYFAWLCEKLDISEIYSKWKPILGRATLPFIAWFSSMQEMLGNGSSDYANIKLELAKAKNNDYIKGIYPKVEEQEATFSGDGSKVDFEITVSSDQTIWSIADIFVDGSMVHQYTFNSETNTVTLKEPAAVGTNNVVIYYVLDASDDFYTVYFS